MKLNISLRSLFILCLFCLPGCGGLSPEARNARLENRLDHREGALDHSLDRMDIRAQAAESRWQKIKGWEEERYQRNRRRKLEEMDIY